MRVIMNMASTIYCLAHGEMLAAGHAGGDPARSARHRRLSRSALMTSPNRRRPRSPSPSPSTRSRRGRRGSRASGPVSSSMRLHGHDPVLEIDDLRAGYGAMEILHGFALRVARGQSLCLIGPNGAGKSTVLHSIFGFTKHLCRLDRDRRPRRDAHAMPNEKLRERHRLHPAGQLASFPT